MSQRTRSRTTVAAARKRPPARQTGASASTTPSPGGVAARPASPLPAGDDPSVNPETLARTLRAVAAELERDPALARRVASAIAASAADVPNSASATPPADTPGAPPDAAPGTPAPARPTRQRAARPFTPSLVTGVSPDLGPGIPDPFALAKRLGPDGLREVLAGLRRGTLRAMIREHGIAPAAQVAHITDDAKLREMILAAVHK